MGGFNSEVYYVMYLNILSNYVFERIRAEYVGPSLLIFRGLCIPGHDLLFEYLCIHFLTDEI